MSIKDFSTRGLDVGDSSYLGISSLSYIDGKDNSTRGIHLVNGASGWINDINIKDVDYGIRLFGSSSTYLNKGEIVARTRGVTTSTSRFLHYNGDDNSSLTIEGFSDTGMSAYDGSVIANWSNTSLIISNGKKGIELGSGSLLVNNGSLTIKNNSERAISAYLADLSFSSSSQTLIEGNNSNNSRGISIGD